MPFASFAHFVVTSLKSFSGVMGRSVMRMPVAASIALAIAGASPSIGISPTPFAPGAANSYGYSTNVMSYSGTSRAVGMTYVCIRFASNLPPLIPIFSITA